MTSECLLRIVGNLALISDQMSGVDCTKLRYLTSVPSASNLIYLCSILILLSGFLLVIIVIASAFVSSYKIRCNKIQANICLP